MGEKFHAAHRKKFRQIQRDFCGIPQFIFKKYYLRKIKNL
ncbi:hypothetical protein BAXH7_00323 [Bacillus amyloliquefaciens XH7]|nr:hypothetical protein LL3_00320 [Bacillus amyloliquefaciens LL3]AEK87471.1 hypothetical protein BAXH7_00323 [Bacillus amyloliquefaciens XH7]QBG54732.1 hypothetical protein D2M30_0367 [Bacillus amyloliquefaciens]